MIRNNKHAKDIWGFHGICMRLQICEHVQQTKQQDVAMSNVSVILQSWKGHILWKDLVTLDVSHLVNQFPTTASVAAQSQSCLRQECESQCYFVCFRAQLIQCILCPVSLKLGCKGLCDCSLFRFELGLRNLQLIWCNCLLVILFVLAKPVRPEVHRHSIRRWWTGGSWSKPKPQDLTVGTKPFHILPSRKEKFKMYLNIT